MKKLIFLIICLKGPPGPAGPPGEGIGYDAASLAAIFANANTQKGPDPQSDEPYVPRIFGKELTPEETKELINRAYQQLKASFEKYKRPNGDKSSPGRTCRDILAAYPDSPSGINVNVFTNGCV